MKPQLLILAPLSADSLERISQGYDTLYAPDAISRDKAVSEHGAAIQAVLTIGTLGLSADEIERMPRLSFVAALGVGYEKIDLDATRARGIVVANGAGSNAACVADHAMALLLAVIRDLNRLDRLCREGVWRDALPMQDSVTGKRLGILGLGSIGEQLARRAVAFDMSIGYHSRHPRSDCAYRYFSDVEALARWCDCLVVAVPGGAATHHLVDAAVLHALGPAGYLVNVARGSVVDSTALAHALEEKRIAGAALDVYESEPEPPQALLHLDNLILTPHVGGRSPQALEQSIQLFLQNIGRHFAGEPPLTPV
ncbi:2-hydroxyacid dehydrogenase [Stutzerimonas nosocomialis]|uniref:2-hydroxyacid dehydrogenase n=1 Tax=Stutzerimonas nosocomialis TaxID=1056496 RepID=A0A5R9QHH7_9GAMM|nr:2-hydroxyacid dehydrogenase [Stutzerimonas nosocomialis]TLX55095.1 2-hydroxyacid dehydrogenase [Stutzerimonas nosocomialis]TLX64333.1 2-hydroxyacid dehydrogenase [Stutzerimonas nosocomialis]